LLEIDGVSDVIYMSCCSLWLINEDVNSSHLNSQIVTLYKGDANYDDLLRAYVILSRYFVRRALKNPLFTLNLLAPS
jgi:hypothetical protein